MPRRTASMAVAVVVAVALAGCGGSAFDDFARSADDIARAGRNADDAARAADDAARQADEVDAAVEKAIVNAFCDVATEVANSGEPKPETQWIDDLRARVEAEGLPTDVIEEKLDQLEAAVNLGDVHPRAAAEYARRCGGL